MLKINLTEKAVADINPPKWWRRDICDQKTPRFGIRVSRKGTKTWFFIDIEPATGKQTRVTLGTYPEVKLADARKKAIKHNPDYMLNKKTKDIVYTSVESMILWGPW